MADSDDSFEGEIERMSSEKEANFEEAPSDILYTFKFKHKNGKTYKMTQYNLTKGKSLPHIVFNKGCFPKLKAR